MIQGIGLANQAMSALMNKQELLSHNLANSNTTGFKQSNLFISSFQKALENDAHQPFVNREIMVDETYVDYREGTMHQTGNPLDVALKGSGFFTVLTEQGVRYTRNGNFSMSGDGFLVTSEGARVVGRDGFVRFDGEGQITIHENGEILQGNETKGVLKIVDFKKPYRLLREGDGCFKPFFPNDSTVNSPGFIVKQGSLEGSNVNAVHTMVQMIAAYRTYEADQKALLAQDQTLDKAVNTIGRIN